MILLTNTTDTLELVTSNGATYDVDILAAYIDRSTTSGIVGVANRQLTTIASATTGTIVAAPAASTTRKVNLLNVRNTHITSSVDVLVQLNANGTIYELFKVTLLAGDTLSYLDGVGFFTVVNATSSDRNFIMSGSSVHATAATWADITGLTCSMKSGVTYGVLACLHHVNNASTTGSQFGYNIGAVPTEARFSTIDTVTPSVTASAHSAGSITARDTAITAQTTGSTSIRLAIIAGYIIPSADGTFAMRATSEVTVAAGLTVQAGSWMRVFTRVG